MEDADENGRRFAEYCKTMSVVPRLSGFKLDEGYFVDAGCGNFVSQKGYRKLLINWRMFDRDGNCYNPHAIDVTGI